MKTFSDLKFQKTQTGKHLLKRAEEYFDNGFGASVIDYGEYYEVGVLRHSNGDTKTVSLSNMFDGPIITKLSGIQVTNKLIEIQEFMNHGTVNRENENRAERKTQQGSNEITTYSF